MFIFFMQSLIGCVVALPFIVVMTAGIAPRRVVPALSIGCLAIVLTILSGLFVNVLSCDQPCGLTCPPQPCTSEDLYAGFPVPFLDNSSGGGSPPSSFERIDSADFPNPVLFAVDVVIYAAGLWAIWRVGRWLIERRLAA